MAVNLIDGSMTLRGALPATFLAMGVRNCPDDLILKDQINILGWPNPAKDVNLANCHGQKSEDDTSVATKAAGDVEFHVSDGLQEAICKVKDFLGTEVVAEVTHDNKDMQTIEAVVFIDFVALQIEVNIQSEEDYTTVMVKDHSRSDVVRLHRFCEQLKENFAWPTEQTLQNVSPPGLQAELLPMCSFDEFDDDWVDNESMRDRADALLNDVTSRNANVRVEGAQVLASWAQECLECRVHIAEALLEKGAQIVEALLQNSNVPLAEAYPLAATLRYTLLCPDAARKLKNSGIALKLFAIRRFNSGTVAAIVAKELSMAVRCLDKVIA